MTAFRPDSDQRQLRLRPRYRPFVVEGEGLFLLGDRDHHVMEGQIYVDLLPYVQQGAREEEVADALEAVHPRALIHYAFGVMSERGLLTETQASPVGPADAFWDELDVGPADVQATLAGTTVGLSGVGAVDPRPAVRTLQALGMQARVVARADEESLHVVLTDDYLDPDVSALVAQDTADGRSCLLCRSTGTELWIGPLFRPGGPCHECLASRLRLNDSLRTYLSRKSTSPSGATRAVSRTVVHDGLTAQLIALEAARWALGQPPEPRIWSLDLQSWSAGKHVLYQRPQCPVCGNPRLQTAICTQPVVIDDQDTRDFTAEDLEIFVDRLTGVITNVEPALTGIPSLHSYTAFFGFARDARDLRAFKNGLLSQAAGVGTVAEDARLGAICEALERYSGMAHGDEPSIRATYAELDPRSAVHPATCMLYSDRQYAERAAINARGDHFNLVPHPFDDQAVVDWTGVWSLSLERYKLLPTSYLFYNYQQLPERTYCWADSNGCAAGSTLTDAVRRGLMELIERDSVAIWWYNKLSRPRVDLASFAHPYFDAFIDAYAELGRELWVLDVTTDLMIPSFVAVSHATERRAQDILLSFGAGLDARGAIEHALCEMNHLLPAVLPENRTPSGDYPYPDAAQQRWWSTATIETESYLTPLAEHTPIKADAYARVPSRSAAQQVSEICGALHDRGLEILVLNQTRPDVGVPVAKVIVPGLRHFWARFAPGRLYDVPVRLGWIPRARTEGELNPIAMFL